MERIRAYLDLRLADPNLVSADVAKGCGFSRRQLYRAFEEAGETFAETLRQMRIERAATLLTSQAWENTDQLAYQCGFASGRTFVQAFRDRFGRSPFRYRAEPLDR